MTGIRSDGTGALVLLSGALRLGALAAAVLLSLPALAQPWDEAASRERLERAALAKAAGIDALLVPANLLETEAFDVPDGVQPLLADLLRRPIETATGGADLADRVIRRLGLENAADMLGSWGRRDAAGPGRSGLRERLADYGRTVTDLLAELPEAPACCDVPAILADLHAGGPGAATLAAVGGAATGEAARRLAPRLAAALATLVGDVAGLPAEAAGGGFVLDGAEGRILVGGTGDDRHRIEPGTILVVDTGGNDTYDFIAPVTGSHLTIIDLEGDDRYLGDPLAIRSFVALADLDGDDIHEGGVGTQAAALGGVALLIDRAGNDRYVAEGFGQAAAALGAAVLIDGAGDDSRGIGDRGQAFGQVGGTALLWDLGGNDLNRAAGPPDTVGRDGRLSQAQGMGTGIRASHGGGIGILRDDSGDDGYELEMFGQGAGYFTGIGVLADGAGNDRYQGVRYVQGAGVHGGIGLLADRGGNDAYAARHGVGQGMGLDMALGALVDGAGDDAYEAGSLAQGAGTANGTGVLLDGGGADRFSLAAEGWGRDHAARGLPGVSFLVGAGPEDRFLRNGEAVAADLGRADGPAGGPPYRVDPPGDYACPAAAPPAPAPGEGEDLTALIRRSAPMRGDGDEALAAWAALGGLLPGGLPALLRAVPDRDFATGFALLQAVRCHLLDAGPEYRAAVWAGVLEDLDARRPVSQPWLHARLAGLARPADGESVRAGAERLAAHPACSAQVGAVELAGGTVAAEKAVPAWLADLLSAMLRDLRERPAESRCLRLAAAILRLADRIGDPALKERAADLAAVLPPFLADSAIRASLRPPP
ncbi:hypothetical protein IGS68_03105 [Skermanella sp. TT6]|uniref:HEAT repeat domain-containing protein n=1 Tax=Skermanella cutis TaxID=2775420 RepID=A0ABX7B7Z6_9PROT|nr:hypothetical protein [Skermanella sp. TT6]QQP90263.1 hypothetical protein IGS68_03105 [Skermanella sp. TT6]